MPLEDVDLAVQNQNQQQEEVSSGFDFLAIYLLHLYSFIFASCLYICYVNFTGVEDVLMEVKDLSTGVYGEPYKVRGRKCKC